MIVYRICSKKELKLILRNKNMNNIGVIHNEDYLFKNFANTHDYIPGVRYMHFFKDFSSLYYGLIYGKGFNVCTYDIDDELLSKYKGMGKYYYFDTKCSLLEYAIPSNMIKFDNLISASEIVWYDDIVDDYKYRDVYVKNRKKVLVKKIFNSNK